MTRELFFEGLDTAPCFYETEDVPEEARTIYARFFDPRSGWEWLLMEYNSDDREGFGLVRGFETEFGYFSVDELYRVGATRDLERDYPCLLCEC